jgi:RES domain-containing protein
MPVAADCDGRRFMELSRRAADRVPLPETVALRQNDTHRLIPAKFGDSVLTRIADDDTHLQDIFALDGATNERLLAERGAALGISPLELVVSVPSYRVINAAFTHAHPLGSRFNGPGRGAWYAAFELKTAEAEIAFHRATEYAEIGRFDDTVVYQDYLADFSGCFHTLCGDTRFDACLDPSSYVASQGLAERLLDAESQGVVYPSVRYSRGTCLACFRPALVNNVRPSQKVRFTWQGKAAPQIDRFA